MTHLHAGEAAPAFKAKSHLDTEVDLAALRGSPVALVFFPLAWTPV